MSESTVLGSVLGWLSLYSLPPDRARKVSLPTEPFISASCADGKTTRFCPLPFVEVPVDCDRHVNPKTSWHHAFDR